MSVESAAGPTGTGGSEGTGDPEDYDGPDPSAATVTRRSAWSTTKAALALLRERGWLLALVGIVVLSVVFVFLGRWQFHRHEARSERNNVVKANYHAAPVPLAELIPPAEQQAGATLPKTLEYRPVTVKGEYLPEQTVLIRNRPHDQIGQAGSLSAGGSNAQNGYEVVVPLRTTDGSVFFVDRGWIPAGTNDASRPDSVPAAPTGEVTVVSRLRPSEPLSSRTAPEGQAVRLNVAALATATGLADERVVGAFGALVSEDPAAADTPEGAEEPDPGIGINLSYSVQWDGFAIVAYILFAVALVREVRRRDGEDGDGDGDGEDDEEDDGPVTLTGATYR
ncbi:SURF1 family cytochrome oxidase biogenesis protein [Kineosporia succinea]|uniref:SURF1-like protein n=1 Tax=Kineosporia succinea TaxID=84632 RepID=A0ABT9P8U4_9ACTN|nr:SURF1 family protein [Kineosporia succinea]MDP9828585.1 cytochrome oxidase assembly protein ShyY1 [Kineosporia succinea]